MNTTLTNLKRSRVRGTLIGLAALAATLVAPATAAAITPVYPEAGQHLQWTAVRPIVAFDVDRGEKLKWVLIGTDAEMKDTVRYCRQFVGVNYKGAVRWGCNAWAIGADAYGQDVIKPLSWGHTYYWTVVYTDADGNEQRSPVRAFAIDDEPKTGSVSSISDQIYGSVYGDGTKLNLGAAAQVNSGVATPGVRARRKAKFRFAIVVKWRGVVDPTRSYVRVKSRAGTRYIRVKRTAAGTGVAVWNLSASERRLKTKRFVYQGFLKAKKNGAMVRSAPRVMLIRSASSSVPAWRPI